VVVDDLWLLYVRSFEVVQRAQTDSGLVVALHEMVKGWTLVMAYSTIADVLPPLPQNPWV
jgi:hypothetical protein